MNWFDCLNTFRKVAECQSFVGAARAMKSNNAVVTKHIQWLERELDCNLFLRTTRKVTLTDQGEYLFKKISPLLDEWKDIHAQIIDYKNQPIGEIKVCLPPHFGVVQSLTNAFNNFLQAYPQLRLNISNSHKPIDLIDAKIDILIAPEKYVLDPNTTIGTKLVEFYYECFAAPAYFEKHSSLKTPTDLKDHNCIIYSTSNQWEFAGINYTVWGNFTADSGDSIISACVAGNGLIYIPRFMVQKELDQKLIIPLLTNYVGKKEMLMIFHTQRQYKSRKIVLLIDFLKGYFK